MSRLDIPGKLLRSRNYVAINLKARSRQLSQGKFRVRLVVLKEQNPRSSTVRFLRAHTTALTRSWARPISGNPVGEAHYPLALTTDSKAS